MGDELQKCENEVFGIGVLRELAVDGELDVQRVRARISSVVSGPPEAESPPLKNSASVA